MTKYEHKIFRTYLEQEREIERELDFWGKDGWELVAVVAVMKDPAKMYYLKRPLPVKHEPFSFCP